MNHKDLVFGKSVDFETIYKLTQTFPDAEKIWFLTSQMRRAVVSIHLILLKEQYQKRER
jgi:four helix bundle protein